MATSKMLFLIMVVTTSYVCMTAGKKEIEELGRLFHYKSKCCRKMAPDCRDQMMIKLQKLNNLESLAAQLTYSQFLDACSFEIDGKTPIDAALSQECDSCDEWGAVLKKAQDTAEFVVNELKVGHLTRIEIFNNPELAEKLDEFEREQHKE